MMHDTASSMTYTSSPTVKRTVDQNGDVSNDVDVDVDDLTKLLLLSEGAIEYALKVRFDASKTYTWAGPALVSINPFSRGTVHECRVDPIGEAWCINDPHVWAVAEKSWRLLLAEDGRNNQTVIVSGESGAGKTVSSGLILKYFSKKSAVAELNSLLFADTILEAFGNAKTEHNDNSSRFGKLLTLNFSLLGGNVSSAGAVVSTYLLEKARSSGRPDRNELNFHIFYQLLFGLGCDMHEAYDVKERSWRTLGNVLRLPADVQNSHSEGWKRTRDALLKVGVTSVEISQLVPILIALMHLGNVDYNDQENARSYATIGSSRANVPRLSAASESALEYAAKCLRVPLADLQDAFTKQTLVPGSRSQNSARRSIVVREIESRDQMAARRDAFIRLIYEAVFSWLCLKINESLPNSGENDRALGILDVYGFESLEKGNSLEQLCINYANERLQQCFVHRVLRLWKEELAAEFASDDCHPCLDTVVSRVDNSVIIQALDDPISVFGIVNEQSRLRNVTRLETADEAVLCRLAETTTALGGLVSVPSSSRSAMSASQTSRSWQANRSSALDKTFCVFHYAGPVEYSVDGIIAKNRDQIPGDFASLLSTSGLDLLCESLKPHYLAEFSEGVTGSSTVRTGRRTLTILSKFKSSLDGLMTILRNSELHFVRCIKPVRGSMSGSASTSLWDGETVRNQLRALGVAATVEVARVGFSNRVDFLTFAKRYMVIATSKQLRDALANVGSDAEGRNSRPAHDSNVRLLIANFLLQVAPECEADTAYRIGLSRVFLSDDMLQLLEKRTECQRRRAAIVIQLWWRAVVRLREEEERMRIADETLSRLEQTWDQSSEFGERRKSPGSWPWMLFQGGKSMLSSVVSRIWRRRVEDEIIDERPPSPSDEVESVIILQEARSDTPVRGSPFVERNLFRGQGVVSIRTSRAANAKIHVKESAVPSAHVLPKHKRQKGLADLRN